MYIEDQPLIYGSWDNERSEGMILIRADFFSRDKVVQLDALKDWITDLTCTYERLLSHDQAKPKNCQSAQKGG